MLDLTTTFWAYLIGFITGRLTHRKRTRDVWINVSPPPDKPKDDGRGGSQDH